ncbi:tetratricopeptide repeat protein [candidate division KSB1 bacterium]|nr:tetratricopeptide repeat protein [candidate division KSB1 bacterium]
MKSIKHVIILIVLSLFVFLNAQAQNRQSITVTIEGISSDDELTHFNNAEDLRKQMRFQEAIEEYESILLSESTSGKESEAKYNIGLCYTWLGDLDNAEKNFNKVISEHVDDKTALAFAKYGLSWIEVQRENYETAINILKEAIDQKITDDYDLNARMLFKMGHIYISFLNDFQSGRDIFRVLVKTYPNAKVLKHPVLQEMIGKL